jgi:predicted oxidoreductase (fatty acid repression mutant protein)
LLEQELLLCIEHNPRAWQTQSNRKAVLLGTQKKSGISGHPKEKRYLIRKPLSYSGPKRKAVFLGTQKKSCIFGFLLEQVLLLCIEHNPRTWQTQSDRKAVLLGAQKYRFSFGA